MATGIQVLHIEKRISIASGLNRHITRKQFVNKDEVRTVEVWVPNNADPDRTVGNVELISRERVNTKGQKFELTLQQAVDLRIREAGVKPRKGQSTCLEMIFSGSRDVMTAMSREELLRWADDTLAWAQDTWGKDNVVSATLHVDEMTPHIHMIVVPIVSGESRRTKLHKHKNKSSRTYNIDHDRLRLCVNEVYTQGKLYEYHDSYAEKVSVNYGLSRGVKAEPGSKKKHTNSIEYNRMLAAQAAEQKALIASIQSDYTDKKNDLSALQGTIKAQEDIIEKNRSVLENQKSDFYSRKQKISELDRQIAENNSIIEDQDVQISTMSQIALETINEKIESKKAELESLNKQILKIKQQMVLHYADDKAINESLFLKVQQLKAQVSKLENVPKKGIGWYKTEEVDSYIKITKLLIQDIKNISLDISDANMRYRQEMSILQKIEHEYNEMRFSRILLQNRLDELKNQENKDIMKTVIKKVLNHNHTDYSITSFTTENTWNGKEMFATYEFPGDSKVYAIYIKPPEYIYCTNDPRVTSLQEAKKLINDKSIWFCQGYISKICKRQENNRRSRGIR